MTFAGSCMTGNYCMGNMTLLIIMVEILKLRTAFSLFRVSLLIIISCKSCLSESLCYTTQINLSLFWAMVCLSLRVLKSPTLMVHEVVSIQSLTGNIDCSSALISIESSLEPLSSMNLYKLRALSLWLLQSLACLSLIIGSAMIAIFHT